ncbi:hypothetical protein CPB83DRAFT_428846 [Crepidotus variabilis]|uniref:Uncharacterized protein n=1 Tax=Crepidotus variabilis TaxID=179855 RepID=A0A9P6EDX1_9AGAR|nr:hypothetical protein CPB83DRAFT_428846 [Crepidotus variabilis]
MGDSSLIDVYLIIRYEGLKATQYFSKFTNESVNELRKDLADIGLPHPKRENIQLLSHGTVECYWQTTRKNNILLNNLRSRSNPTPENKEKWKDLSMYLDFWKALTHLSNAISTPVPMFHGKKPPSLVLIRKSALTLKFRMNQPRIDMSLILQVLL